MEQCIIKITELKDLEEADQPVPDHIKGIIQKNLRMARVLEVKYKL